MFELIVEDIKGARRIRFQSPMTIGRSRNNDVVLHSITTSRRHAQLWQQGDQVILEDLGSTHGTLVNGLPIVAPRFLRHNDVITLGGSQVTFLSQQAFATEPPAQDIHAPSLPRPDQTPMAGQPHWIASQLFCANCGAPNHPQARFCEACGQRLLDTDFVRAWSRRQSWPSYSHTPVEPVISRPFPSSPEPAGRTSRGVWILILFMAILAAILLAMLGLLLTLTLG